MRSLVFYMFSFIACSIFSACNQYESADLMLEEKMTSKNRESSLNIADPGPICLTPYSPPPAWVLNEDPSQVVPLVPVVMESRSRIINFYVHIVRTSSGSGAYNGAIVDEIKEILSDAYSANFYFNSVGYQFINDDFYYNDMDVVDGDMSKIYSLAANNVSGAVNIYILGNSTSTNVVENGVITGGYSGIARDIISNMCVVKGDYYQTSTTPHEVGHCLGLYHTFQGTKTGTSGCPELVNGSNSSTCGDYIADTPADPDFWTGCTYSGGGATDANGDFYAPDPTNIMAYTGNCRVDFTGLQENRIRNNIENSPLLQSFVEPLYVYGDDEGFVGMTNTYEAGPVKPSFTYHWEVETRGDYTMTTNGNTSNITFNTYGVYGVTCYVTDSDGVLVGLTYIEVLVDP